MDLCSIHAWVPLGPNKGDLWACIACGHTGPIEEVYPIVRPKRESIVKVASVIVAVLLVVITLAVVVEHYRETRSDCFTIYTLSQMVLRREAELGHQHPGKGPLLSAEITEHCRRYGVDIPAETH